MAKLKDTAISKEDINEYLQNHSDFSFEIEVLRKFISTDFYCQHAGTYEDPVTKKTREFDIRASKYIELDVPHVDSNFTEVALHLNLCFCVECKNLRDNFPLVVHCMPRDESECYLDLIWSSEPNYALKPYLQSRRIRIEGDKCPYGKLDPVGKSCDQVGRRASQNGELIGNDADVFSKISQAINSSYDLVKQGHYASKTDTDVVTIVVPVLVVPDERLWTVWYNKSGGIEQEPKLASNIEYFLEKKWVVGNPSFEYQIIYSISHMEIVQLSGIENMVQKYCNNETITTKDGLIKSKRDFEQSKKGI